MSETDLDMSGIYPDFFDDFNQTDWKLSQNFVKISSVLRGHYEGISEEGRVLEERSHQSEERPGVKEWRRCRSEEFGYVMKEESFRKWSTKFPTKNFKKWHFDPSIDKFM